MKRICFLQIAFAALLVPSAMFAQKFAFDSTRDGNGEIYVANFDGSGLSNLTDNPALDYEPQWSPDGTRILFRSDRSGQDLPYVMNADGSNQTMLPGISSWEYPRAQWSTDGAKILLTQESATGPGMHLSGRAAIATPDGSQTTPIDALPDNHRVRWSPDGSKILYLTLDANYNFRLHAFNVAGNSTVLPSSDGGHDGRVEWSPDSSRIFVNLDTSRGAFAVYDVALGSRLDLPGPQQGFFSQWSPDGSKILLGVDEEGGYGEEVEYAVVNADGSGQVDLSAAYSELGTEAYALRWSPDSTELIVQRDGEVFVANVDGSSLVSLGFGRDPVWSSDGSRIFFLSNQNDRLHMVKSDGSALEDISSRFGPGSNLQPFGDFSTDPTPAISSSGVVLANLVPAINKVSPLSIVSIFGTAFSAGSVFYPNLDGAGKIETILGGTCVEIGGERAPIFAMTPNQANVQVPSAPTFGPVSVTVIRNCGQADELRSAAATVTVEEATPAFFLYPPYKNDGLIAARFNDGYAAVAPEGTISDGQGPSRPAKPGDIIVLFGTGWGRTEAGLVKGERGVGADKLLASANPMVTFGGIPLAADNVLYVGSTPEAAGLYQLAIRVPATALPGPNQVVLTVYGKSTPAGPVVTLAAP